MSLPFCVIHPLVPSTSIHTVNTTQRIWAAVPVGGGGAGEGDQEDELCLEPSQGGHWLRGASPLPLDCQVNGTFLVG